MSTLEVLRAARERYAANPAHTRYGRAPTDGSVCAVMAIDRGAGHHSGNECDAALHAFVRVADLTGKPDLREAVIRWNARRNTAEVLAVFDRAIAIEEAKAAEFTATPEPAPLVGS